MKSKSLVYPQLEMDGARLVITQSMLSKFDWVRQQTIRWLLAHYKDEMRKAFADL